MQAAIPRVSDQLQVHRKDLLLESHPILYYNKLINGMAQGHQIQASISYMCIARGLGRNAMASSPRPHVSDDDRDWVMIYIADHGGLDQNKTGSARKAIIQAYQEEKGATIKPDVVSEVIFEMLGKEGEKQRALCNAITNKNVEGLRGALTPPGNASPDSICSNGIPALLEAVKKTNPDDPRGDQMVAALLEAGANPNVRDPKGNSPLLLAAWYKRIDTLKILFEHGGVDPNFGSETADGYITPLYVAVFFNHPEVVKILIDNGADVNKGQTTSIGDLPLHCAAREGRIDIVQLLLGSPGINVNEVDGEGRTPLMDALNNQHFITAKLLLAAPGIQVDIKEPAEGMTALFLAVQHGNVELVEALLLAGADPKVKARSNVTPLHIAASVDSVNPMILRALLRAGAQWDARMIMQSGKEWRPIDIYTHRGAAGENPVVRALLNPSETPQDPQAGAAARLHGPVNVRQPFKSSFADHC